MTCLRCWRQDVGKPRGPGELGSAAKLLLEDGDGEPSDLDVLRQERSLLASGFTEVRPVVWHSSELSRVCVNFQSQADAAELSSPRVAAGHGVEDMPGA
eukprot:1025936-Rhodomonas_salina.3